MPMFFVSFRSEVSTISIIKQRIASGKKVLIPKTDIKNRELTPFLVRNWEEEIGIGAYGIPEPLSDKALSIKPSKIDIVIVPGSVFDLTCSRYGYGGGFYDRFLSIKTPNALRIALAFEMQIKPLIKIMPHDEKMDMIITERRVISCFKSA